MPAGKRDQRIKFQREGTTSDGQGGMTGGWIDVGAETWAEMKPAGGRDQMVAVRDATRTTYRITLPNRRDITGGMRVVWSSNGDQILKIIDMSDPGSRAVERTIVAELGASVHK